MKHQSAARDELLSLRKQRQDLALEIDAVRSQYEAEKETARKERELDDILQDIQLAVQRGRAAERKATEEELRPVGLELRLRNVVDGVSSSDGREGLVGTVRGLNEALEAAIAAA